MKKTFYLLCFTVALLSTAFAQDYNLTGAGARAEGFGGAFIGLADDATAVVWNPAGLSQLERAEASVVTRFISETLEDKYDFAPSLNSEESQSHFSLNFGSFALPLSTGDTKIVAAVAFQRQLDFYFSNTDKSSGPPYDEINQQEDRGGANTITPAIAVRLASILSAGIAVNIWTGSIESKSRYEQVGNGRNIYRYNLDYSGLNFVVGTLFDFEGLKNGFPMKIGMTLRTPFTLKAKGPFEIDEELPDLLTSAGTYTLDASQKIEMPLMIGFGTSYRFGDNFTVAMDYEIRNYGSKKIKYEVTDPATGNTGTSDGNISASKKGLNEFRVGAEYLIVLDNGVIPIRAGFKTVPTVYADVNSDGSLGNQVSGSGLSFGSGFIADAFALDVTYGISSYIRKWENIGEDDFSIGALSTSIIIYF